MGSGKNHLVEGGGSPSRFERAQPSRGTPRPLPEAFNEVGPVTGTEDEG